MMRKVESFEHFKELQLGWHKRDGMKKTNFLMPEWEITSHINANAVKYEHRNNCACVVLKFRGADWLYYWCSDTCNVFIPAEVVNPYFAFYGFEGFDNEWDAATEVINLPAKSKLMRCEAKINKMVLPEPSSDIILRDVEDCSYQRYIELHGDLFDPLIDCMPTEYMWNQFMKGLKITEAFDENGTHAGFHTRHITGKRCNGETLAVYSDFRGRGVAQTMFRHVIAGYDVYIGWIHKNNVASLAMHRKIGVVYNGQYRMFHGL